MRTEIEQRIWQITDRLRGGRFDPSEFIEACHNDGIEINSELLGLLIARFGRREIDELRIPYEVSRFITRIAQERSPKRVLDPCAGLGFLAAPANAILQPESFDAYAMSQLAAEVWAKRSDVPGINFQLGDGLAALLEDEGQSYDAILTCPPFGVIARGPYQFSINEKIREVKAEYAQLLALASCMRLNEGGVAVFVVANAFSWIENGVKSLLAEMGYKLTAAVELPAGIFAPLTNIATHIVVLEKAEVEQLFTGRLSTDPKHNQSLFENLVAHQQGKASELGVLVDPDSFRGFSVLELMQNLSRAAKRQGLVPHSINNVLLEINAPKSSTGFKGFPDKPNSVYLPQMAMTHATTRQQDLPDTLKSYFQLIVDPNIVSADFLAGLLNTSFGQLWRDSLRSGSTIPRISKASLEAAEIYLPAEGGTAMQQEVIECQDRLRALSLEIRELEKRLWQRPSAIKALEKQVAAINREDRYEDWVETLPFPLASILWSCHTQTGSLKEKYDRKLHFFEALAEFIGVIHMSAYSSNDGLWADAQERLNDALKQGSVSLEMATFGTWAIISAFFGKKSRGLLGSDAELVFELYKTNNREVLEILFSKKLVTILQETNKIRNDYSGHVGAVSEREAGEVNDLLQRKIQEVRAIFGIAWEEYRLILPGEMLYRAPGFATKVKLITGTRTPFQSDALVTTEPMQTGSLHLISPDQPRGLKLLPFVKVLEAPKSENTACYFYNRRDARGVRFLSYYFEGEAEVVDDFGDVTSALEKLGTT